MNYDVWSCPSCGQVEKGGRGAFLTRYTRCAECGARTAASSSQVLEAATTSSEGLVRIEHWCEHCGHRESFTRSTPRLARTSNAPIRGWRSLSASSSSSRSSSSHSRSSGGGGRSSGRGASGRW